MTKLSYRWMAAEEVDKIADIDRSERIRTGYVVKDAKLEATAVNWDSPSWQKEGDGEHSVAAQIAFCREHLARGGRMMGAFDGERLAGIGMLQPAIRQGVAQLAYLHVSRAYRRSGIGRRLAEALEEGAIQSGAEQIYVSSTPSESAVNFYLSRGFRPVDEPIPELFALEPEDIHMMKELPDARRKQTD